MLVPAPVRLSVPVLVQAMPRAAVCGLEPLPS